MGTLKSASSRIGSYLSFEKNLRVLLFTSLVMNLGNNLWVPLLGLYITNSLGVATIAYGLMNTVQGLVSSLTMLPSGFLSDRFGRKNVIILSYMFSISTLVALLLVRELPMLFIISILRGLTLAFVEPTKSAYIIDVVSEDKRGISFATFSLFQSVSTVVATSVAGAIANAIGFVWVFSLGLMLETLALVLTLAYLKESLKKVEDNAKNTKESISTQLRNSLRILKSPSLLAILFGIIFHQIGLGIQNPYLTIYASNVLMFSLPTIGLMLGLEQLGILLGHFPSGKFVDKRGGEISFALHIVATSPAMIFYTVAGDAALAGSTLFLWGLTFGLDSVSRQKLIPKYASGSGVASAFGMVSLIAGVMSLVSPTIGGWIWTSFSPQTVFYTSAAVNVLGSIPLFLLWHHNRDSARAR
jgi:predicted MFS family arabinose efflux permease